ncbi:MAG: hypothetical protein CJBNEKGG_02681 [Prosthecobacter sp.]|nr:hypothetical protein [Prosthecobacter sp.]
MKTIRTFLKDARRSRGLALIIVLSMIALATIVMLAFLSVADTEHKGTMTYSSSQSARRLADTAVNIVVGQIRAGSDQDTGVSGREIHATQPGAVRKYTASGAFLAGYKLFSDASMIYQGSGASAGATSVGEEYNFVRESEPPAKWNEQNNVARYVDLNEPVVKGVVSTDGAVASTQTYFPIIDPRAAYSMNPGAGTSIPVEGFQYSTSTAITGRNIANVDPKTGQQTIVQPPASGGGIDSLRLAMPVQWLYMLKDGTLGTLNDSLKFVGTQDASARNPIVARLAFWTDDETCKININTASEPTFQGRPIYYHERDHRWADYSAARNEYQRFPGHPATVALSSVLYPNPMLDLNRVLEVYPIGYTPRTAGSAAFEAALSVKNRIYNLIPRIHSGGSNAGTSLFAADTYDQGRGGLANAVEMRNALTERLYASVDELLFSALGGTTRTLNETSIQGGELFTKQTLERASAFLTAHSRASEISMLGLPRIAMWPINTQSDKRTGFDNLIMFCSRLGARNSTNLYYFQRELARSPTTDINLPRNKALLNMLDKILSTAIFPAETAVGGAGNTFKTKMRSAGGYDNYRQVIVEMFDYIRSTNLHDSYLSGSREDWPRLAVNYTNEIKNLYDERDNLLDTFRTFTPGAHRNLGAANQQNPLEDRVFPGHGQVTPSVWNVGGQNYRGFGRSVSISEIGLQFICTADGQPDMYSWRHLELAPNNPDKPGVKQYKFLNPGWVQPDLSDRDNPGKIPPQVNMSVLEGWAREGKVSGGRTALRLKDDANFYFVDHLAPEGFGDGPVEIQNLGPGGGDNICWQDAGLQTNAIKMRFYSNFPPITRNKNAYGALYYGTESGPVTDENRGRHADYHPGLKEENWNYTLPADEPPLSPDEKQVQAMFHLEFFCPSVGYTTIFPEFTVVLRAQELQKLEVNGGTGFRSVFSKSEDVILKSADSIFTLDSAPEVGGYASFRRLAFNRNLPGIGQMPPDSNYSDSVTSRVHSGLVNMDLVSNFFKVQSDVPLQFRSTSPLRLDIYDGHDQRNRVQTIFFNFPTGNMPSPDLVTQPSMRFGWVRSSDQVRFAHPTLQAPRWWAFHRGGALGRFNRTGQSQTIFPGRLTEPAGRITVNGDSAKYEAPGAGGRSQRYPGSRALIYGYEYNDNYKGVKLYEVRDNRDNVRMARISYGPDPEGKAYNSMALHSGTDVVRSLLPGHGDARLLFAKAIVQAEDWSRHPLYDEPNAFMAHNFSSYGAGSEPGFDRSGNVVKQLMGKVDYDKALLPTTVRVGEGLMPDAPFAGTNADLAHPVTNSLPPARLAQRYFDFDESDPGGRVGSFINKPDEGNMAVGFYRGSGWTKDVEYRFSYFRPPSVGARFGAAGRSFFTPNRVISSPVVMGSLPSRVYFSNPNGADASSGGHGAWTNLLFRPHVLMNGGLPRHPGQATPPDHYLLDLFWMPVVEPYAISEPLSTAGKVNMNYQMLPFTHIRRATALHAVMKAEVFAALPNVDHAYARSNSIGFGPFGQTAPLFRYEAVRGDIPSAEQRPAARWHRSIVVDRFNNENGSADSPWWTYKAASRRVVGTLRQFEERFNFGVTEKGHGPSGVSGGDTANDGMPSAFRSGLFRSASQICELHLIPSRISTSGNRPATPIPGIPASDPAIVVAGANEPSRENVSQDQLDSIRGREDAMANFWNNHLSTGDNTREAPYSNLYAKLTTRSNTFRVHVRVQTLKKALRGSESDGWAVDKFTPGIDEVTGEYRGSFLLERYVDMTDLARAGTAADFTTGDPLDETAHPPLDSYYRFRVIESKRFAP